MFGRLVSCCTVLCACPLDVGIFCVFCTLFCLPNVGQRYNDILLFIIVILCAPNLANEPMPLRGGPARSSPLYHFGFGVVVASLLLRGCFLQLGVGKLFVLPSLFVQYMREQRFKLFRTSALIAVCNSMQWRWESVLECSDLVE